MRSRTLNSILEENAPEQISFLKIDVEGSEADVLASIDLSRWRPRVILLEATLPCGRPDWDHPENHGVWNKWEPDLLKAGYTFAHFDGLNRFYVRNEDQKLIPRFHLPPGVFDEIENFSPLPPSGLMPLKSSVPIVVKTEAKRRVPDTAKATRRLMKNAGKRISYPQSDLAVNYVGTGSGRREKPRVFRITSSAGKCSAKAPDLSTPPDAACSLWG